MKPSNIQAFIDNYELKNYKSIMKRFSLNNTDMVDQMASYFQYIKNQTLFQDKIGSQYSYNVFGQMIQKTLMGKELLGQQLGVEVVSRYVATDINKDPVQTC